MNKTFRLIWSDVTRSWVAVAENVSARGKRAPANVRAGAGAGAVAARLMLTPIALALSGAGASFAAPPVAGQLPTGGQVVAGSAAIAQNGAVLNVNQATQRAAIDWQTFNVGSGARVNFNQPSAAAVTLNRVLDASPSQIFGRISAPGQVFLTNPNGVYFAPGASVDVGGLIATTHQISNADFMAGNYRFTRGDANGSIVNEGELRSSLGGYIALLAPEVRNLGVVVAQLGTVAMAAGEAYELRIDGNGGMAGLRVDPSAIRALVDNGNAVHAPGGRIILSALALNALQGSVVRNSGTLEASSLTSKGGRIVLEADAVTLTAGSRTQATGATGGGTVLVGGGWQGSGDMHQAVSVTMEAGAGIDVSATGQGDGGTAVLWSDVRNAQSKTRAYGSIAARGGAGGAGGRIETSGHWLDVNGIAIDTVGSTGIGGEWLLDPYNVTISTGNAVNSSSWAPTGTGSNIKVTDLTTALNAGTSITVTTGTSGTGAEAGNISVNTNIAKTAGGNATLTLRAHNDISLAAGANIYSTAGKLDVVLNSDSDGSGAGAILMGSGSSISSNGGNVTLAGGSAASGFAVSGTGGTGGVQMSTNASINTNGGNVLIRGKANVASSLSLGVNILDGASISTGAGAIDITGQATGTSTATENAGILVNGSLTSVGGNITLTGSNTTPGYSYGTGIQIGGSEIGTSGRSITSATGSITLTGTASATAGSGGYNRGVHILDGYKIANTNGGITINGTGAAAVTTGSENAGVLIDASVVVETTGGGSIAIDGTGGGNSGGYGVFLVNSIVRTTGGGNLSLTGRGTTFSTAGNNNEGVKILGTGLAEVQTGAGNLTIHGTGGSGGNYNIGVNVLGSTVRMGAGAVGAMSVTGIGGTCSGTGCWGVLAENGGVYESLGAASITFNGTGGTGTDSYGIRFNGNNRVGSATMTGGITLIADKIDMAGSWASKSSTVQSKGALTIRPKTAGTTIGMAGGAGTLAISSANLSTNLADGFSGITIGSADAGKITTGAATVTDKLTLQSGSGGIELTGVLNAGSNAVTLNSSGAVTDTGSGAITAGNLLLLGGQHTLDSASNNVAVLAANAARVVFTDANTLGIGSIDGVNGINASDVVSVETVTGNLTVSRNVATTNTTASAVTLNAGRGSAALTSIGGDLLLEGGPLITTGAGGTARLFSGSVAGSTGLTSLIGSGSGRFRYGSDETQANYSASLGTGLYAIYRERPVVTVTARAASKTYDGNAYSGGNGVDTSGFINGDLASSMTGTPAYGGAASGAVNAGSYAISVSGMSNSLGYGITYADGTLTVNRRPLTLSGSRAYDGTTGFAAGTLAAGNLVAGDCASGLAACGLSGSASVASANVQAGVQALNLAGLSLGGAAASNYTLGGASGTASVTPKSVTVTGLTAAGKTYDGTTVATISNWGTASTGVGTETLTLTATGASFNTASAGAGKTVTATGYSLGNGTNGGLASNYALTSTSATTTASIAKAPLTVRANDDAKFVTTADEAAYAGASYSGFVNGETSAVLTGTLGISRTNAGTEGAGNYSAVLVPAGLSASNYDISYAAGNFSIIPAGELLVKMVSQSTVYGTPAAATVASARYMDGGNVVHSLSQTGASGNTFSYTDNAGGAVTFTVAYDGQVSSSGNPTAGIHAMVPSAVSVTGSNFNALNLIGSLAVQRKAVSASASGVSKVYDGSTSMSGMSLSLSGVTTGDAVGVTGTGAFDQKNVGTGIGYSVSGLALNGADSGNYLFSGGTTFTGSNGVITARPVTVAIDPASKTYGDADSALTYQVTAGSVISGDSLGSLVRAAGENAGNYAIALSSLSNANYDINGTNGTFTINRRPIAVTADAKSKTYGDADPALTYTITSGNLVGGDTLGSVTRTVGENAGGYAITTGSLSNDNYDITGTNGIFTINRRPIAVTADAKSKTYGDADPALTYTITSGNLVGGDTLGGVTRTVGENAGTYLISTATLSNANYQITGTDSILTIARALLTVSADDKTRKYGEANPLLTYTLSGFVRGENATTASVSGQPVLGTPADRSSRAGKQPIQVARNDLAAVNYDFVGSDGVLTIEAAEPPRVPEPVTSPAPALPTPVSNPPPLVPVAATRTDAPVLPADAANQGVTVSLVRQPTVQASGMITVSVPKETATSGQGFSFPLPAQALEGAEANANIGVAGINGEPLPAWLRFDRTSNTFIAAAVPEGALPVQVAVTVGGNRSIVVVSERKE